MVPFILIDDDELILNSVLKLIQKAFPSSAVYTAQDGDEGYRLILSKAKEKPIIITDLNMPGHNGFQIIQKVREEDLLKSLYIIVLTSETDTEKKLKIIQRGADDLLSKPIVIDEFITRLKLAATILNGRAELEQYKLDQKKQQKEKNEEFLKIRNIFYSFLERNFPDIEKKCTKIARAAVWIANEHSNPSAEEINDIERAALFSYIGYLALDDKLIKSPIMKDGFLAAPQMAVVSELPSKQFEAFPLLSQAGDIIKHIYENIDGSGFPSKLKKWEIPLGSRIIRVLKDYYEFCESGLNQTKAMEMLFEKNGRLYDHFITAFLDQFLARFDPVSKPEIKRNLEDLEPDLLLSRTIYTQGGLVLVPKATQLNGALIVKIKATSKTDGIIGDIYTYESKSST